MSVPLGRRISLGWFPLSLLVQFQLYIWLLPPIPRPFELMTGQFCLPGLGFVLSLHVSYMSWSCTLPPPRRASSAHPSVLVKLLDQLLWTSTSFSGRETSSFAAESSVQHGVWNLLDYNSICLIELDRSILKEIAETLFSFGSCQLHWIRIIKLERLCPSPSVCYGDQRSPKSLFW